jgi:hypothetical protein
MSPISEALTHRQAVSQVIGALLLHRNEPAINQAEHRADRDTQPRGCLVPYRGSAVDPVLHPEEL